MRIGTFARASVSALSLVAMGACASDFDTSRTTTPRASVGHELFTVVCDRVGAQSLREDVTGASFHAVCHRDANGQYASRVDVTKLPPLNDSVDIDGHPIAVAIQAKNRAHFVARVDALARRRDDLIAALDATIPDAAIPRKADSGACPAAAGAGTAPTIPLQHALSKMMGNLIDLYNDDTLPDVTRALGQMMNQVKADPEVQSVLARFDARQGYRPLALALGVARPALAYPRFIELAQALMRILVVDGPSKPDAAKAFDALLAVAYQELRTPESASSPDVLAAVPDAKLDGRAILSRPRTMLEATREIVTTQDSAFMSGAPALIVRRDARGYASVKISPGGTLPSPFVDQLGPNGKPDGLPDIDTLGRFLTTAGALPASPFFSPDAPDGPRDALGRATDSASGTPMYEYLDTHQTFLSAMLRDIKPFFAADHGPSAEVAMNFLAGLPVLSGDRDPQPVATKTYPPDANELANWKLAHTAPPPANLGKTPVSHAYRAFHPESSPLVDLVHAFGQIADAPELDDMLALVQKLTKDPDGQATLANLVGMTLELKAMADAHTEATLPAESTFWDDTLAVLATISHEPGLLEDVIRAFADPKTLPMESAIATYLDHKDDISYDTNNLNGPSANRTTNTTPANFVTRVDRTQPDTGANRSQMQKFLSLLHDTNGLSICTKDNAVVHIRAVLPNTIIPINFDYPTDNFYSPLICGLVGAPRPAKLERCAVFGYTNVMELLLDVILDKALLTVRDPCLSKLMDSSLTGLVGGADAFLQVISGVDGFSLHPNLRGFARLLYFETPYPGLPTDTNPANDKTLNFLKDTIDPIESMVCAPAPFTAADGKVFPLRKCATVADTLRARDPNALFPVDELNFVPALRPLAQAFKTHNKPLLFASLLDAIHVHYGSKKQTKAECDPSLPHTDPRWCGQDGLVSYEPLLLEMLKTGVFGRVQTFLNKIGAMKVPHCTAFDPKTRACTTTTDYDGVHVVAEMLNRMLDAQRTPTLTDRQGNKLALRNDGTRVDPIAPIHLFLDGLKGLDSAFASFAGAHPQDAKRRDGWRAARSSFADTFLSVTGKADQARFDNKTLIAILPAAIGAIRAQVFAHCQTPGVPCAWAKTELVQTLSKTMSGPTYAALVDLADAVRRDDTARAELEQLIAYLLDAASSNDAQGTSLAAALDILQVMTDDTNLGPLERLLSNAVAPTVVADDGTVKKRSLASSGLRSLAKIFERSATGTGAGAGACVSDRDPDGALGVLLKNLVTPMGAKSLTPLEVVMDVIGDVNRAAPESTTKLGPTDYANIANEMSEFFLDDARGLEQFYAVIRQATQP